MADWIYCNKCAMIYKPHLKYFLTECSHIFCQSCIVGIKETKCVICQTSNRYIEICKEMEPDIKIYFTPFDQYIKKGMEIWQFQLQQRMRQLQTVTKKYAFAKRECIKIHNKNKELVQQNKMLHTLLEQAKESIKNGRVPEFLFRPNHQLATSTPSAMTPAMTSDRTGMDNMSQISSIPPCTPGSNYGSVPTPTGWNRAMVSREGQHLSQVGKIYN
ncbi:unnamed protein product [Acanthoscelides obtectus]|uniref:RING-type domain-containing protein n=1 Tax=Acanthoscelides obtectus TaxID=200917 RepID=A0A9P0Q1E6_ACAOB|nr:unnamed protein product [Acanthoscelides obtectus]CAK1623231.1 RING finger protein 212B [Acanthoscelides obtectus]